MNEINKTLSTIKIRLPFESKKIAEAIDEATSPENKEVPEGITAKSAIESNCLVIEITSKSNLKNLQITVDDYLEKIDLSTKTIAKLKK